jgi:uncharacterized protein YvpB
MKDSINPYYVPVTRVVNFDLNIAAKNMAASMIYNHVVTRKAEVNNGFVGHERISGM